MPNGMSLQWQKKKTNEVIKITTKTRKKIAIQQQSVAWKKKPPQRAERVFINSSYTLALMKHPLLAYNRHQPGSQVLEGAGVICLPLCQLPLIRLSTCCQCGLHFNLNTKQFDGVGGKSIEIQQQQQYK